MVLDRAGCSNNKICTRAQLWILSVPIYVQVVLLLQPIQHVLINTGACSTDHWSATSTVVYSYSMVVRLCDP